MFHGSHAATPTIFYIFGKTLVDPVPTGNPTNKTAWSVMVPLSCLGNPKQLESFFLAYFVWSLVTATVGTLHGVGADDPDLSPHHHARCRFL